MPSGFFSPVASITQLIGVYKIITLTIAGSGGKDVCSGCGFGGSQTWRSLISLPLKMMYSNISSLGATGLSVGRSSVPNERTEINEQYKIIIHNVPFVHIFKGLALCCKPDNLPKVKQTVIFTKCYLFEVWHLTVSGKLQYISQQKLGHKKFQNQCWQSHTI